MSGWRFRRAERLWDRCYLKVFSRQTVRGVAQWLPVSTADTIRLFEGDL